MPDEAGGSVDPEPPHTFEAFRARKIEEERLRRLHATEAARLAVGTRHQRHYRECSASERRQRCTRAGAQATRLMRPWVRSVAALWMSRC